MPRRHGAALLDRCGVVAGDGSGGAHDGECCECGNFATAGNAVQRALGIVLHANLA